MADLDWTDNPSPADVAEQEYMLKICNLRHRLEKMVATAGTTSTSERRMTTEAQSRSTESEIWWPFTDQIEGKQRLQEFFSQNAEHGCHYRTPAGVISAFFRARTEEHDELYDLLLDGLLSMLEKETSMEIWQEVLLIWFRGRTFNPIVGLDPILGPCLYKGIQHFRKCDKVVIAPYTGLSSIRNFLDLLDLVETILEKDIEAETASTGNESSENER